jgi:hypothetical protein
VNLKLFSVAIVVDGEGRRSHVLWPVVVNEAETYDEA